MVTFIVVTLVTLAPFIVLYLLMQALFAWDDRRWNKAHEECRYCR